ncbi:MAG: membrane protein insertion efficiency factor YidD [Magnetospiraceae bacterium]
MTKLLSALFRFLIRAYQLVLSPVIGGRCRYQPSCSQYGLDAIAAHGPFRGGWLTLRRLARCHPWGGYGYDPVPDAPHTPHPGDCSHPSH